MRLQVFGNASHKVSRLECRRREIDDELAELAVEQVGIESLIEQLESRRRVNEGRWARLLSERDQLDENLWQQRVTERRAARPRPPVVNARAHRSQRCADLAREPWELDDDTNVVPLWVAPSHTMRMHVHARRDGRMLEPRRQEEEAVPHWVSATRTSPIWRREA